MIERKTPVPAYYQVKMEILQKIKKNEWKVGDQLPTNLEFCDLFGVSRITIHRALSDLEADGYIYRIQGKGSFVKFKEINQNMNRFYSFSEETIKMGYVPTAIFLDLKLIIASSEVREALDLEENEKVYVLERLRLADEVVIAYDRSYIPEKLIPGFQKEMIKDGSLYKTLRDEYRINPNSADESIEALSIPESDAIKMRIKKNQPVLLVKRVAQDNERKIEFNYRIVNSSVYKYRVHLD